MGAARRPDRSAGRFPFSRAFAERLFCAAFANGLFVRRLRTAFLRAFAERLFCAALPNGFFVRCGKRAQRLHFGGESGIIRVDRYRGRYPLDGGAAAGSKPPPDQSRRRGKNASGENRRRINDPIDTKKSEPFPARGGAGREGNVAEDRAPAARSGIRPYVARRQARQGGKIPPQL